MAGIVIPLIAGVLPDLITLIAGLVHKTAPVVELTNGPLTGPVKFAEVFAAVTDALQKAAAVGAIPKALPPDDLVKLIIQAVVSSMKLSGLLGGPAVAVVPVIPTTPVGTLPQQAIVLRAGQSLTITVAP